MKRHEVEYIYNIYLSRWGDRLMHKLQLFYLTVLLDPLSMIRFLSLNDPVVLRLFRENRMHDPELQEYEYLRDQIWLYVKNYVVNIHNIHVYQSNWVSLVHQLYDPRDRAYLKAYWLPLDTLEYTHFLDLTEPGIRVFKPMYICLDGGYWAESNTFNTNLQDS